MSLRLFMTTDAVGGVWRYSLTLAAELAQMGASVRLGVIGPWPAADQRAEAASLRGVETERVDAPLDWLAGDAAALRAGGRAIAAAARAWGADLVQVNQPAYATARFDMPVVSVAHSCVETWWHGTHGAPAPAEWAWHRDTVRAGLRSAAVRVAPSRAFAAILQQVYGLERPPLAVPNGIAPGVPESRKGSFVLASGRAWDSSKNFSLLDEAAPTIGWPVRLAGACVAPAGATPLVPRKVRRLRNVRCLGHLDRCTMQETYAAAPIYVSPSLHEPFGLGVLEAAGAGAALVLSDIPSFRELWNGAALFFGRRDAAALADAANRLIEDPGLRRRMATAARERAALYTIAGTAQAMRAAYRSAAQLAGAAA
jgi:glycosyltransferase involved in cell wall biosynthesis